MSAQCWAPPPAMALFTIGAVLARSQMNHHEQVAVRDYVPVARIILVSTALAFFSFSAAVALLT